MYKHNIRIVCYLRKRHFRHSFNGERERERSAAKYYVHVCVRAHTFKTIHKKMNQCCVYYATQKNVKAEKTTKREISE